MYTFIDLFCGAGGFSEGLKQLGFECILAIDNWETALKSHEINHPEAEHWCSDILFIDSKGLPKTDIIIASPPCKKFSRASGKTEIDPGPTLKVLEIIKTVNPKWWLIENVIMWGKWIKKQGYSVMRRNAHHCGVSQTRERYFVGKVPMEFFSPSQLVPVCDVVDVPKDGWSFNNSAYANTKWRRNNRPFSTLITQAHRYSWHDKRRKILRKISVQDYRIIQGFPEGYQFIGKENDIFIQIGNAVPPALGKSFFKSLVN